MDDSGVGNIENCLFHDRILTCQTAMPIGSYDKEIVNLNVDSLWRGGPFENPVRDTPFVGVSASR